MFCGNWKHTRMNHKKLINLQNKGSTVAGERLAVRIWLVENKKNCFNSVKLLWNNLKVISKVDDLIWFSFEIVKSVWCPYHLAHYGILFCLLLRKGNNTQLYDVWAGGESGKEHIYNQFYIRIVSIKAKMSSLFLMQMYKVGQLLVLVPHFHSVPLLTSANRANYLIWKVGCLHISVTSKIRWIANMTLKKNCSGALSYMLTPACWHAQSSYMLMSNRWCWLCSRNTMYSRCWWKCN